MARARPAGEWTAAELRLPKLPVRWFYRPAAYPAWDRRWRAEHKGLGASLDDHLWRAAQAVRELEEAE